MAMGKTLRTGRAARRRRAGWPLAVLLVAALAGAGFVAAHVSAAGTDLRPATGDVTDLLSDRAAAVKARQKQAADLQKQIDRLSAKSDSAEVARLRRAVTALEPVAGFTRITGAGVRVTLNDAPTSVKADGIDQNLLVVHQQDIQSFVNALWAGGAEAVTLQGQRLISTNGIRCVGNTVVLDGIPYSPPYVIEAVGEPVALRAALDASSDVAIYREWAQSYDLGLSIDDVDHVVAEPYAGSLDFRHATVVSP